MSSAEVHLTLHVEADGNRVTGFLSKQTFVVAAAILLTAVVAQDASAIKTFERDGWNAGISLGFGRGRFVNSEGVNTALHDGVRPIPAPGHKEV